MTNDFEKVFDTTAEPQDYTGEDGLLYCGSCRTPKERYFPADKAALFGRDRHPAECDCQRAKRMEREAAEQRRKHLDTVEELKRRGFTDSKMREWTFANDNGKCPQMGMAHGYVERWEQMKEGNHGLLLWGKVGTGKSYFAGCIANALMEKEIPVRMTNFALILNDLAASFEGRNEYIDRLCHYPLLIIDDFGMERGTEYGLEQVYSVIDSRYRSGKPLIATTNLTLEELQHPQDKYCNNDPRCRAVWDRGRKVVKFAGYDAGEKYRSEKVLLRDLADPKYSKWYPLMEWGWYREGCIRAIEAAGLPQPGKSSCFFCPSMKESEIIHLRERHPDLFRRACALEDNAQANLQTVQGLGRNFSWKNRYGKELCELGNC